MSSVLEKRLDMMERLAASQQQTIDAMYQLIQQTRRERVERIEPSHRRKSRRHAHDGSDYTIDNDDHHQTDEEEEDDREAAANHQPRQQQRRYQHQQYQYQYQYPPDQQHHLQYPPDQQPDLDRVSYGGSSARNPNVPSTTGPRKEHEHGREADGSREHMDTSVPAMRRWFV